MMKQLPISFARSPPFLYSSIIHSMDPPICHPKISALTNLTPMAKKLSSQLSTLTLHLRYQQFQSPSFSPNSYLYYYKYNPNAVSKAALTPKSPPNASLHLPSSAISKSQSQLDSGQAPWCSWWNLLLPVHSWSHPKTYCPIPLTSDFNHSHSSPSYSNFIFHCQHNYEDSKSDMHSFTSTQSKP